MYAYVFQICSSWNKLFFVPHGMVVGWYAYTKHHWVFFWKSLDLSWLDYIRIFFQIQSQVVKFVYKIFLHNDLFELIYHLEFCPQKKGRVNVTKVKRKVNLFSPYDRFFFGKLFKHMHTHLQLATAIPETIFTLKLRRNKKEGWSISHLITKKI